MKKTNRFLTGFSVITLMFALLIVITACPSSVDETPSGPTPPPLPELSGSVTISVQDDEDAFVGCTLVAEYDGTEPVTISWQWINTLVPVGTTDTHLTTSPGIYTVLAIAPGYQSKLSSNSVTVTDRPPDAIVENVAELEEFLSDPETAANDVDHPYLVKLTEWADSSTGGDIAL